jgi:hypothetical protein
MAIQVRTAIFFLVGAAGIARLAILSAASETVIVKYRGEVSLAPFSCTAVERSSFIKRVCYDNGQQYMLINLNAVYYHYCEIDSATVSRLIAADSIGRYYNTEVKGHFDCRTRRVPTY